MKIGVLLKQVPDSETKVKIKADGLGIELGEVKFAMNPYDEFAVEEALKTQAKVKGEVVVFTVGGTKAEEAMRAAMAMGADRGVRINDDGLALDSLSVGKLLAAAVKMEGIEALFAGKQAIDDDGAQIPQIVAELLDWPQVTVIESFEAHDEKSATAGRRLGGGAKELVKVTFPAVFTADKGLNSPRFASLPGIMKAKKKPLAVKTAADLGVALGAPAVKVTRLSLPPARQGGKMLKGDAAANVKELVRLLHEEAKVI